MSHSAEYKKNLTGIAEVLERYSKVLECLANVTKDKDMKIVYETLRTLNYYLGRSYLFQSMYYKRSMSSLMQ
jgi:hypothetical protein